MLATSSCTFVSSGDTSSNLLSVRFAPNKMSLASISRLQRSVSGLSYRTFTSVKRSQPYTLTDLPSLETRVTLLPNAETCVPMGSFKTSLKQAFIPGFSLEPNPREEPEILIPKPDDFRENPEFWRSAGQIIRDTIHKDPFYCDLVAAETRTPYFHIYDQRLPPVFGRIPEVEDILGTVELDSKAEFTKIVPGSFEQNSMYRPVTKYGAMLVSPFMFKALAQRLG